MSKIKEGAVIEGRLKIKKTIFLSPESTFGIFLMQVIDLSEGNNVVEQDKEIVVKGNILNPIEGDEYNIRAIAEKHVKYGMQFTLQRVSTGDDIVSEEGKKQFLLSLFPPLTVDMLYQALEDPFDTLSQKDTAALVKIHGIKNTRAENMIRTFKAKEGNAKLYNILIPMGLTENLIGKLIDHYNDADIVIQRVTKDPYQIVLDRIEGIGWKRVDSMAAGAGVEKHSTKRAMAFIYYYLQMRGDEGDSYIEVEELQAAVEENLGEDFPQFIITEAMRALEKDGKLWSDKDHTKVGLKSFYDLEQHIAQELIRLRDGENSFEYGDWMQRVRELESDMGWEFTDEQIKGVETALKEQVVFITGPGGSGKTSLVAGVLKALGGKYTFAQCALAGRAGARLTEVTGEEGFTIHRLLGMEGFTRAFLHDKDNPLPHDIIIVDEVSMIGASLFYSLIQAIKTGAKLIMLGDAAQLPAIGKGNVAYDILQSPYLTSVRLTKIHRQAAKSGIVTESIKISKGVQIIPKDWTGTTDFGELHDFAICAYESKDSTFYRITEFVSLAKEKGIPITDLQVVVPTKTRGAASVYNLNQMIQEIYNPGKKGVDVLYETGKYYNICVGDKVINRKNRYDILSWDSIEDWKSGVKGRYDRLPIFNGNMGTVIQANTDPRGLIVDVPGMGVYQFGPPAHLLNGLHLAYAITCHSMQGSECDNVIVGLDYSSFNMLNRNWVYTAITRAKKKCILCCQTSALRSATFNSATLTKNTHLQSCLEELNQVRY